ncbi:hypothetical protein UH38_15120 [Aliterella atlantica CENA595]|uniref:Uncharacterized protein n=1 Tax=Aliterella atlantica CENA595 TaxID=1618023 RepID=A0A0D8ZQ36_9CYAN|nr:hypothetical protein UH38_15120 [Aliterella atlantica CENA595]
MHEAPFFSHQCLLFIFQRKTGKLVARLAIAFRIKTTMPREQKLLDYLGFPPANLPSIPKRSDLTYQT